MKAASKLLILVITALFPSVAAHAQVVFVAPGATGTGASWSDPTGDLQGAINAAGLFILGEVRVAQGTYTPGANPGDSFSLVDTVTVKGGYFGTPGSELDANARDPNPLTNNTVLSGEIAGPALSDNIITIVTANQLSISDTDNTVLESFTLTAASRHAIDLGVGNSPTLRNLRFVSNGDGNFTTDYAGAGLTLGGGCNAVVEFCEFTSNLATAGGAVDISGGRSSFKNCLFQLNSAVGPPVDTSFLPGGGAVRTISFDSAGDPSFPATTFRNCTFLQNSSISGSGGAILKRGNLHLIHCAFTENTKSGSGHDGNGAGLASCCGNLRMHDCDFTGNFVSNDFIQSPYTIVGGSGWYSDKETVEAACCRFFNNTCDPTIPIKPNAGAVALDFTVGTVDNFTVADNEAPDFGGLVINAITPLVLRNVIAWNNIPPPDNASTANWRILEGLRRAFAIATSRTSSPMMGSCRSALPTAISTLIRSSATSPTATCVF